MLASLLPWDGIPGVSVPTVCLDTSRDIPAGVAAWQEVGLSPWLLQLLCPAQNMLRIQKSLLGLGSSEGRVQIPR